MSSLRANLSDTLAAARLRATRSGDTLRSMLSPTAAVSSSTASYSSRPTGVTFASLGRQMAGLTTAGLVEGEGGSGEFSLRTGSVSGLSIFVLDPGSCAHLCLGAVNGGIKFCLAAADKCSVGAHQTKVDVSTSHVYINAGRNAAFTDPHVPVDVLGSSLPTLLSELHPREDWLRIFQSFLDLVPPDPSATSLVTPKKRKFRYLPDETDSSGDSPLSSFSSWDVDQGDVGKAVSAALHKLENRFTEFQIAVGEDVDSLFLKLQELKAGLGVKPSSLSLDGFSDDCVTLWETFTLLTTMLAPSRFQALETKVSDLDSLSLSVAAKIQALETGQADVAELTQLLSMEQDHLAQWARAQGPAVGAAPASLVQEVQALQQQLSQFGGGSIGGVSPQQFSTLQTKLALVEARLPSDPFLIGGRTFNSKADVALFVEKELSGVSFSLFHDPITLLESVTDGQSKKTDVMAAMYQASRIGFDEDEATHVHSFKLIVPSLLGATKEGDKNDPKYPLPAVKDFGAWNPQDNEGGVKKRMQDGMEDVSLAVTESINVSCASSPAASKLAMEMLYQTQVFINELCSWVDSFYLELIKTSQVPETEAWLLVAACIRKFCEVLRKFRAPADRAASKMDSTTRTTVYLWAMIQVHREMKVIRGHSFRGHPAVAPVITLHVFKTRVTNSAFSKLTESFKSLDKRLTDVQKNFDKLQDRISRLDKKGG
jgi:hypothetical protein